MDNDYNVKNRIWISTQEGTFLGEGRIKLLKEIDKSGSISKAAKAMNMSYKKAWDLVNSMNKSAGEPVVLRSIGGKNGGGSAISEKGQYLIQYYTGLQKDCRLFLENRIKQNPI